MQYVISSIGDIDSSVYIAVLTYLAVVFCLIQHVLEALEVYHSFREDCHA